ncbi:MAG: dCTP deaminase [Methanolinea sp.]|nr:dCTP deaminase [Methanolinea sp.]
MILSSREITRRMGEDSLEGDLVIRPYDPDCQQPASYDLRIGGDFILPPGACTLVHSLEWVEIPPDLAATLRCRSSFGRRGLVVTGGFVDPGFRGQLTLCLINMGSEHMSLRKNDRVVQMILHEVTEGNERYDGRYQDSSGIVGAR